MSHSFAILPAAGRSERMGEPKLLLQYAGKTIIEHVVATWKQSRVEHVIVVVHPDDEELATRATEAGAEVVRLDAATPDMKATILNGLAYVREHYQPQPGDVWLVAPADTPRLHRAAIDAVLAAYDPQAPQMVAPYRGEKRGHPVLFPWALADEVGRLAADEGLNRLVERGPLLRVPVEDPGILADLDTPDDYRRLLDSD